MRCVEVDVPVLGLILAMRLTDKARVGCLLYNYGVLFVRNAEIGYAIEGIQIRRCGQEGRHCTVLDWMWREGPTRDGAVRVGR